MAGHVSALVLGNVTLVERMGSGPLAGLGFGVVGASTEDAARQALNAKWEDIHVIILDAAFPTAGGASAFLAGMRSHPAFSLLPTVLLTATADESDVAEAIQAGAFHVLRYPCSPQLLTSVINAAVEGRKRMRQLALDNRAHEDAMILLDTGRFRFRTPREANSLAVALAEAVPASKRLAFGLLELLMNAVEHGNLGIGYANKSRLKEQNRLGAEIEGRLADPRYRDRVATVEMTRTADWLTFTITDQGEGFDWHRYVEMEPERAFDTHGRGIVLARAFTFDTLTYLGNGSTVVAAVDLSDGE